MKKIFNCYTSLFILMLGIVEPNDQTVYYLLWSSVMNITLFPRWLTFVKQPYTRTHECTHARTHTHTLTLDLYRTKMKNYTMFRIATMTYREEGADEPEKHMIWVYTVMNGRMLLEFHNICIYIYIYLVVMGKK